MSKVGTFLIIILSVLCGYLISQQNKKCSLCYYCHEKLDRIIRSLPPETDYYQVQYSLRRREAINNQLEAIVNAAETYKEILNNKNKSISNFTKNRFCSYVDDYNYYDDLAHCTNRPDTQSCIESLQSIKLLDVKFWGNNLYSEESIKHSLDYNLKSSLNDAIRDSNIFTRADSICRNHLTREGFYDVCASYTGGEPYKRKELIKRGKEAFFDKSNLKNIEKLKNE